MSSVLKYPWITEKATSLQGAHNQYIFVVDNKATKKQIAQAVKVLKTGIDVVHVNISNVRGKIKRLGRF